MPVGLFKIEKVEDFTPLYFARLDQVGVDKIRSQISQFEKLGKPVVLLCFEDVRKPDWWCHRRVFADWWQRQTGEVIEELIDPSAVKTDSSANVTKPRVEEPKKKLRSL